MNKKVAVLGGAGHIGFPLSLAFAKSGFDVTIVDPSDNVDKIKNRISPYLENKVDEYLNDDDTMSRINYLSSLETSKSIFDFLVVTVGTPVDEWGNPNSYDLQNLILATNESLKADGTLILRSTILPVFTQRISELINNKICFCPERVTQGNSFIELSSHPQIIGCENSEEFRSAKELFGKISPSFLRTSYTEAELAKMMCNFYRYATFGIANSIYNLCEEAGVNPSNVFNAIKKDYPRGQSLPSPGLAAGPCLYKDTIQLNSVYPDFRLGDEIIKINEGMGIRLAEKACDPNIPTNVLIVGAAFKANCDDFRDSLSFKIRKTLYLKGVENVDIYDPNVQHPFVIRDSVELSDYQKVVIATRHDNISTFIASIPEDLLIEI